MGASSLEFDTYELRTGGALSLLKKLPDESVQTVCTSPPYYSLRNYGTAPEIWGGEDDCEHQWGPEIPGDTRGGSGPSSKEKRTGEEKTSYGRSAPRGRFCEICNAWQGELGLEPTIALFIEHLVAIFREVRRVLRPDGTCFLNIADTYYNAPSKKAQNNGRKEPWNLKRKDLCGVPQRLVLALQEEGWVWRNDNVWSKAGGNCPRCYYRIEKGSTKPECLASDTPVFLQDNGLCIRRPLDYVLQNEHRLQELLILTPSGWQPIYNVWATRKIAVTARAGKVSQIVASSDHRFPIVHDRRHGYVHDTPLGQIRDTGYNDHLLYADISPHLTASIRAIDLVEVSSGLGHPYDVKVCLDNSELLARGTGAEISERYDYAVKKYPCSNGYWSYGGPLIQTIARGRIPLEVVIGEKLSYEAGTLTGTQKSDTTPTLIPLDEALGRLVGFYAAEGGFIDIDRYPNQHAGKFSFHVDESDYVQFVVKQLSALGTIASVSHDKNCNATYVKFCSSPLRLLFKHLVPGSCKTKSLNLDVILNAPLEFRQGLLAGYLEGDGHKYYVASASKQLIDDYAVVAASVGYMPSRYAGEQFDKRTSKTYKHYALKITKRDMKEGMRRSDGSRLVTLRDKKTTGEEIDMIDLEVEGGLFIIDNGLVTHNSVKDRFVRAHEYVYMLVKQRSYFFDHVVVREPHTPAARRDVFHLSNSNYRGAHTACVDEKTECLTSEGWKHHSDLRVGELAAHYDIDNDCLSWAPIELIARYDVVDEELVHCQSNSIDMLMTDNHRCVIRRRHRRTRKLQAPVIVQASQLKPSHLIPTTAKWDWAPDTHIATELAELLGWYVSDGCERSEKTAVDIYQSRSAKPQNVDRIETLLKSVGANWSTYERIREETIMPGGGIAGPSQMVCFHIMGDVARKLRDMAPGKKLQPGCLLWSDDLINSLLDGLIAGDGHVRKDDGRRSFIQSDVHQAGLVQALAIRAGLSAVMSPRASVGDYDDTYAVYMNDYQTRGLRGANGRENRISRVSYTGVVWCPKLPNGTWVARRNGRVFITGNTMPESLAELCVRGGSPDGGSCSKCMTPYKRLTKKKSLSKEQKIKWGASADGVYEGKALKEYEDHGAEDPSALKRRILERVRFTETIGWEQTCKCKDSEPVGAVVLDPFSGCYDADTSVLTRRGFVTWSSITNTDEFATRDSTGIITYSRPIRLIRYHYEGVMHHYKGRSLDLLVTPDHQMLVREHHSSEYHLVPSHEMTYRYYRIPNRSTWGGKLSDSIRVGNCDLPSEAWLKFVGLFIAEGSVRWTGANPGYGVYVKQSKSQQAVDEVRRTFVALREFGRYREHTYEGVTEFILQQKDIHEYCKTLGRQSERCIPRQILDLDVTLLKHVFDGLMLGDGCVYGGGRAAYYTSSAQLANDVAELIIKLGHAATIDKRWRDESTIKGRVVQPNYPEYCVRARYSQDTKVDTYRMRSEVDYSGEVFCADVPPNHTLLVERNGKISWCGNSGTTGAVALRHGRRYIGLELLASNNVEIAKPRLDAELEARKSIAQIDYLPTTSGVYQGKAEILLHRVPPESVRLILTDPPYNVSKENNFDTMGRTGIDFEWDGGFDQETWVRLADKALMPGGSLVLWNDWKVLGSVAHLLMDLGYEVKRPLTWIKSNPWPRNVQSSPVQRTEYGLWAVKRIKKTTKWVHNLRPHLSYEDLIFRYAVPGGKKDERHKTKKPDDMFREIIQIFSNPGDLVLDPFVGGGTTSFAAAAEGRRFICFDESERWTQRSIERGELGKEALPLQFAASPVSKAKEAHKKYKKLCKKLGVDPITFELLPEKPKKPDVTSNELPAVVQTEE